MPRRRGDHACEANSIREEVHNIIRVHSSISNCLINLTSLTKVPCFCSSASFIIWQSAYVSLQWICSSTYPLQSSSCSGWAGDGDDDSTTSRREHATCICYTFGPSARALSGASQCKIRMGRAAGKMLTELAQTAKCVYIPPDWPIYQGGRKKLSRKAEPTETGQKQENKHLLLITNLALTPYKKKQNLCSFKQKNNIHHCFSALSTVQFSQGVQLKSIPDVIDTKSINPN